MDCWCGGRSGPRNCYYLPGVLDIQASEERGPGAGGARATVLLPTTIRAAATTVRPAATVTANHAAGTSLVFPKGRHANEPTDPSDPSDL